MITLDLTFRVSMLSFTGHKGSISPLCVQSDQGRTVLFTYSMPCPQQAVNKAPAPKQLMDAMLAQVTETKRTDCSLKMGIIRAGKQMREYRNASE